MLHIAIGMIATLLVFLIRFVDGDLDVDIETAVQQCLHFTKLASLYSI
jgi:hypothetical protein